MVDDAEAAQARALLKELHDHVENVSRKIDAVERHQRRQSIRGTALHDRQRSELRRELYEAHRLIDGLHRRYPEVDPARSKVST